MPASRADPSVRVRHSKEVLRADHGYALSEKPFTKSTAFTARVIKPVYITLLLPRRTGEEMGANTSQSVITPSYRAPCDRQQAPPMHHGSVCIPGPVHPGHGSTPMRGHDSRHISDGTGTPRSGL